MPAGGVERPPVMQGEKRRRDSSAGSASTPAATPAAAPGSFAVVCRREMYDSFQTWALKTYGDSAKTKTVTRKKYNRIGKILKGEEQNNAENSKFRFWVKAKGFRMGPPPGHANEGKRGENVLYVPCAPVKPTPEVKEEIVFKKVAVVENFFDIIYNVHVEMDGRGGKHAGQKRTYKAIAESYAFLPREAVTKFLMQCSDCQKRMHAGPDAPNGATSPADSCRTTDSIGSDPPEIDYSLPITTTYLKHLRNLGYSEEEVLNMDHEDSLSNEETGSSGEGSPHPADEEMSPYSGKEDDEKPGVVSTASSKYSPVSSPLLAAHLASEHTYDRPLDMTKGDSNSDPSSSTSASAWPATSLPLNMSHNGDTPSRSGRHHAHHSSSSLLPPPPPGPLSHRHSHPHHAHHHSHHGHGHHMDSRGLHDHTYEDMVNGSCHDRTTTPEDLSGCVKEEDDEEDDEVDEKMDTQKCDPERLKAFNMFVRLFVDENLDRMVPISKQPKEKIQAIIDSCSRQFPEFSERSRKRIRTYLKSCRRTKRCRDQNGWDPGRPTPPHLTSAMAEQILAAACDNESNNAKRMRLGLDPISVCVLNDRENNDRLEPPIRQPSNVRSFTSDFHRNGISTNGSVSYRVTSTASPAMPNGSASPSHPALSGKAQSNSSSAASSPKYQASSADCPTSTGPADLTVKKESSSSVVHSATSSLPLTTGSQPPQPPAKCPLNPSEVSAVRQLIAGYRESAAFLVRSADELEQLLLQQN